MNYLIYAQRDATIYESSASLNTGVDEILEVDKLITTSGRNYNSRILIKFDLTSISSSIVAGDITSPKFYLNLSVTDAYELPAEHTLYIYPVSGSWNMGIGKYNYDPGVEEGVSWKYRLGYTDGTKWATGSFQTTETGSYSVVAGGGNWYTGSYASQSYTFESNDMRADVTNIVNSWLDGTYVNNGFIIKRLDSDEASTTEFGSIKYFSTETHTIYVPKLETVWDDSSWATGSLTELTDEDIVIYTKGLREEYVENSKIKVRVYGRARYPTRTYSTSSNYSVVKYLPSSSYYEVRDAYTEEVIMPFDTSYTKLSCDSTSNYLRFWTDGLQVARFYKFVFRVDREGGDRIDYYDDDYVFKVIK